MSDEVILKTSFMGFNKQEVMDYIETLQKENRELKKRIARLEGRPEPEDAETQPEKTEPEEAEAPQEAPEELPKISNVNLQNPLEEESTEEESTEEDMEPDVAAAINKADEAIAEADKSIVLNDDKYDDAVTAIYNAVMEAVSHSEEIQLELDDGKKEAEEAETPKPKSPVKVKVKIRPKKGE